MRNQSHRFIYTCVCALVSFIITVVALTSSVFAINAADGNSITTYTLFRICVKSLVQGVDSNVCGSEDFDNFLCDSIKSRYNAARAFTVMSAIFVGILLVVASIRMVSHFNLKHWIHVVFVVLNVISVVVLLIAFPVVISIYTSKFCQDSPLVDDKSIGIGSCGELLSVSFAFTIISIIIEVVYKPTVEEEQHLDGSVPEGMEYGNYGSA